MPYKDPEAKWRQHRRWRLANPDRIRGYGLKGRYGITLKQYDELFVAQDGLCAICRVAAATDVDHCHRTREVRGLLCRSCNLMLGRIEREGWLERVLAYVKHGQ